VGPALFMCRIHRSPSAHPMHALGRSSSWPRLSPPLPVPAAAHIYDLFFLGLSDRSCMGTLVNVIQSCATDFTVRSGCCSQACAQALLSVSPPVSSVHLAPQGSMPPWSMTSSAAFKILRSNAPAYPGPRVDSAVHSMPPVAVLVAGMNISEVPGCRCR
jgi:hypothetical protein